MLHLLLSTDWIACREEILRRISQDVKNEKGNRIWLVPELISHDTERRLCAGAGNTVSRFAEVLSFSRLVQRVAEHAHCAVQPCLDKGGRVVAMAAATRQLHSKLKAYAAVETKPEFLTAMVEAVDEFKRCCITSEILMAASHEASGSLAQKLEDLGFILEAYDSVCSRGKRDPRDQMNWVLELLADGTFGEEHTFYVDGFPDFTRQHLAVLEHLIQASPSVTIGLNCDRVNSGAMAFEKAADTAAQLIKCARNAGIGVQIETVSPRADALHKACCSLFQGSFPEDPELSWRLQATHAESVYDEVLLAAQAILDRVHNGSRYRDISVVCSDIGAYQSIIQMVFHRCNIPVYQSGTEDILQMPVIATVLSAMDAALSGFEQRDVLRYLKSCLSPLDMDACDYLENYAILWGITGKRWLTPWTMHPDGLGEVWTESAQEKLAQLNRARELTVGPLQRLEQKFRSANSVAQQVIALYEFLEQIHFAENLEQMATELDAAGDNRGAQILNQLWEILLNALEQLHDVLGATSWDAENFVKLLSLLLSQYDVGTIPPMLDAVMVGPVSAMRCQQEKHLLVLGAEEGLLPSYGGTAGVLTDQERTAVRSLGVPLTGGAMEGLQAEFSEIFGVFCGVTDSISVFYSGAQPSYVYRRLAQMAGKESQGASVMPVAQCDLRDAGAYLAAWGAENEAADMGVEKWYADTLARAGHSLGKVSLQNVQGLYGKQLNLSASQIDRQAECRMSYFLKYGMRAKERKEATVDPAEFGTYVHWVLEQTARRVMELGGFKQVSLEEIMEIAASYSSDYAKTRFSELDSSRLQYLFTRNQQELQWIVTELWQELRKAEFVPVDFETAFGENGKMPAIPIPAGKLPAVIRGFVDRVDIWNRDGLHYFRVVDYKTGKKDFDYCDIFNGIGLQMLLYLFALEHGGEAVVGEHPIGAGVQYFSARVPLLASDGRLTKEEAEEARSKEWKRKGLLLNDEAVLQAMEPGDSPSRLCCTRKKDGTLSGDLADRAQLKQLETYIFRFLSRMVDDIASGNVEPNPYTRGSKHDACAFCPYGPICHKTEVTGRRNYQAMTSQRFWEEIGKEVPHHG